MRFSPGLRQNSSGEQSTTPGRRFVGSPMAGILAAAAVAVTGCGSSASTTPAAPTILNTEQIERAIEQSSLAQRAKRVQAMCPSGVVQKKGVVFSCTAVFRGGSTQFVVTQTDGAGHVHYQAR